MDKKKEKKHDRVANTKEIEEALQELTEVELNKLERFADFRIQGLGYKKRGRVASDLLSDAIFSILAGSRKWNPGSVDFFGLLCGAIRSISSHWAEERSSKEVSSSLLSSEGYEKNVSSVALGSPSSPEDLYSDKEMRATNIGLIFDIKSHFFEDGPVQDIIEALEEEMSPPEIREVLKLSMKEYETTIRRLRRRVRNVFGSRRSTDEQK